MTELRSDLPRDVARLVKHCLEKEPKRRFQTVLDLRNELVITSYSIHYTKLYDLPRRSSWLRLA